MHVPVTKQHNSDSQLSDGLVYGLTPLGPRPDQDSPGTAILGKLSGKFGTGFQPNRQKGYGSRRMWEFWPSSHVSELCLHSLLAQGLGNR